MSKIIGLLQYRAEVVQKHGKLEVMGLNPVASYFCWVI